MMQAPQRSADDVATVARYRPVEELIPRHWSVGDVEANGIRQHYYRTGGAKPAIVLLHGFQESALTWLGVAGALEGDYDVIMPDARGHGRSGRASSGFSPALLAEDAAALIRALDLDRPVLLGHSLGAGTAATVAAAHPGLVRALVLEDPVWEERPRAEIANNEGYRAWLSSWLAWLEGLKGQTHRERLVSALGQVMPGQPIGPEERYVAWVDACAHLDLDLIRDSAALWAMPATPVRDLMPRIACPALLMRAAQPFPVYGPPAEVREEPSGWPDLTIVRFMGTGHLIHAEQHERFLDVVRAFLAGDHPVAAGRTG
jgi:N-formylmaleamate deformylase